MAETKGKPLGISGASLNPCTWPTPYISSAYTNSQPTSKKRIDIDIHHGKYISRRVQHFGDNLFRLIQLRYEVWIGSLLQRVKDLSLDLSARGLKPMVGHY
ncbi:hypothetical protein F5883DRAFT_655482 [Diaporthe sp. PMI_573]|nr:hypothetical protein F5883DRAFT_655482 [Diaporthaceae sp. PMI_573]